MAASFPTSAKTWTPVVDNVDDILAEHINEAYSEIIAIETNLIAQGSVYIQDTQPTVTQPSLWVQTEAGKIKTMWFVTEDI